MLDLNTLNIPKELIPSDARFGCGPSLLPVESMQKLAETAGQLLGTSHRKNKVKNLVKEVQDNFRTYFKLPADYQVLLGNGGATFLWDMMALGMVEEKSLHFVCGEFSEKWYKAHKKVPWIKAEAKQVDFGQGINPSYQDGFDFIACTLNETSTGVQLSSIPAKKDKVIMAVDATSGAGQIYADMKNIDLYYFSPQKVFAGEGGLFIAFASPRAVERMQKIADNKSRYIPVIMDWKLCLENSIANQTYNTPAVSNFFFINEQLKKMIAFGGEEKVCLEAKRKADFIYNWAESKDYLSPFIAQKEFRSQAVATIDVKDSIPVDPIIKFLADKKFVYDIDGYRKLGRNQFRVSLFHNVTFENVEKLTKLLSYIIEKH